MWRSGGQPHLQPAPDFAQRGGEVAHHRFRMRRAGREAQPLGAARHGRIIDRLNVAAIFREKDVADLLRPHRIADEQRHDVGGRRHHRQFRLGEQRLELRRIGLLRLALGRREELVLLRVVEVRVRKPFLGLVERRVRDLTLAVGLERPEVDEVVGEGELGVAGVGMNNVQVVDTAEIPERPSSPSLPLNLALALLAGLALAMLGAACGGGGDGGGGGGAGGTVVVGMRSDFSGLNPITNSSIDTDQVLKYGLYTPLIQYDQEFNPRLGQRRATCRKGGRKRREAPRLPRREATGTARTRR